MRNVYLVKIGPNTVGDAHHDICKDKECNFKRTSCWLLGRKLSRVKLYFCFACETEDFVIWNFCFLFTFEGNIQCATKVLRLAMEHADGDKCKIVFTSPEAMMEFSGEKS